MQSSPSVVRRSRRVAMLVASIAAAPAAAVAQPTTSSLPTAQEVVAKHVKAIGGEESVRKHTSLHQKGTFQLPAMGMTADVEIWAAAPNLSLVKVNLPGMGEINQGFDGTTAWAITPQGPRVLEGKEAESQKAQANFYGRLFSPADFKRMDMVGPADFEGKKAYKLKLVTTANDSLFAFFDAGGGLYLGSVAEGQGPTGPITATTVMTEYKDMGGGTLVPTRIINRVGPQETVITITSVEYDKVDKSIFTIPPGVKK